MKSAYVCGPLTELPVQNQPAVKNFYTALADLFEEVTGVRAFVPHEHYDPVRHASFTPKDVDLAERKQVCERTSLLLVVAIAPSWGGGIEVEMARCSRVPVLILCPQEKLIARKISRLLLGNPAVIDIVDYVSEADAFVLLRKKLWMLSRPAGVA